ncbi:uncharacterized protein LOC131861552 [Cryptomeria japonica]|uniref:uncharacterized protein LOC131861552 n=1 Tax=Cryptomeria japonica TaxID=3369 RepID=UPI0027DA77A5|nr:uncharacterized protein LOC131861552 [Cryptomeria japonica]
MDACHLLLGRPWKYDVDARHEGRKSVYIITKNGVNFTMMPLPDDNKDKHIVTSVMLVDEREFMKGVKEKDTPCFGIVVKPKIEPKKQPKNQETERRVGPKHVQNLLDRYKGIVVDSTTNSLPPQREISHCIDLMSGATLPNKAAYKLTPEKNAEVTRQIQELLEKGFIRKSISPCAVPVVLAPKKEGTWRLCTDSRAINKITIRYRFPIPRMEDLMDCRGGAKYYSKMDLKSGHHPIRIRDGDQLKITFKTNEGLFEWMAGETKSPANKVVDALSRRNLEIQEIQLESMGINALKYMYQGHEDFKEA